MNHQVYDIPQAVCIYLHQSLVGLQGVGEFPTVPIQTLLCFSSAPICLDETLEYADML